MKLSALLRTLWAGRSRDANHVIQSLWIGPRLSVMEKLAVCSFLRNGHEFHLYVYEEPRGIPPGTSLRDASQILPASKIFMYKEHQSYSGFANFFRYKLLLEHGGWYVDMDTVCLRPFDCPLPYVFSSEDGDNGRTANTGMIKVPRGSKLMKRAWEACRQMNTENLRWGQSGPALLAREIRNCVLDGYVQDAAVFCPIPYREWEKVLDPGIEWGFAPTTYAVHLWNEMWRRNGRDKDARYDPRCLYEQLKRRYLE